MVAEHAEVYSQKMIDDAVTLWNQIKRKTQ
jgi:hypothetical protein